MINTIMKIIIFIHSTVFLCSTEYNSIQNFKSVNLKYNQNNRSKILFFKLVSFDTSTSCSNGSEFFCLLMSSFVMSISEKSESEDINLLIEKKFALILIVFKNPFYIQLCIHACYKWIMFICINVNKQFADFRYINCFVNIQFNCIICIIKF